jgi:hypothetical protein
MAFRVNQTTQAKHDLDIILGWLLAQYAGETGLRWFQGLKEAVASLSELRVLSASMHDSWVSSLISSSVA